MPVIIKKYEFHTKKTNFIGFIIKFKLKKKINKKEYFKLNFFI